MAANKGRTASKSSRRRVPFPTCRHPPAPNDASPSTGEPALCPGAQLLRLEHVFFQANLGAWMRAAALLSCGIGTRRDARCELLFTLAPPACPRATAPAPRLTTNRSMQQKDVHPQVRAWTKRKNMSMNDSLAAPTTTTISSLRT